jgi:hypothetical protein
MSTPTRQGAPVLSPDVRIDVAEAPHLDHRRLRELDSIRLGNWPHDGECHVHQRRQSQPGQMAAERSLAGAGLTQPSTNALPPRFSNGLMSWNAFLRRSWDRRAGPLKSLTPSRRRRSPLVRMSKFVKLAVAHQRLATSVVHDGQTRTIFLCDGRLASRDELVCNLGQIVTHDLWLGTDLQKVIPVPLYQRCFPSGSYGSESIPRMARDETEL